MPSETSEVEQRIAEIRERLQAATTRPWITDVIANIGENWLVANCGSDDAGVTHIVTTDSIHASELTGDSGADAEFIANAPTDIAFLLGEYDKAHDGSRRFKARADEFDTALTAMAELVEQEEGVYSWQRVYQNIERIKQQQSTVPSQIAAAVAAEREAIVNIIAFRLDKSPLLRESELVAAIRARGES